jgi:hypothetical protein
MISKKLIAIAVVFALAAGTAFAVDLGGTVFGDTKVASSSNGSDAALFTGGNARIRLEGSGDADIGIGTVGGWMRFDGVTNTGADASAGIKTNGLAWWQPADWLKLQIGVNPDGHYDASHITRYGFYAMANEFGLVTSDGNWGPVSSDDAIFGGYGSMHFGVIIPLDAVSINVAIPLNVGGEAADTFKASLFQVNYAADFGAIHVTYQGLNDGNNNGKIFGSVFLGSLVEGLGLELGLGYTLVEEGDGPLSVGLGASYEAGALGIKLRTILGVPGGDADIQIRVDLLPSYALNDNVTIFGDLGILLAEEDNFIWHLAPYVRIGSAWGPQFLAGLRIMNADDYSTKKNDDISWSIPIGIAISF